MPRQANGRRFLLFVGFWWRHILSAVAKRAGSDSEESRVGYWQGVHSNLSIFSRRQSCGKSEVFDALLVLKQGENRQLIGRLHGFSVHWKIKRIKRERTTNINEAQRIIKLNDIWFFINSRCKLALIKMRLLRFLMKSASIEKHIDYYSRFSPSPLSMKQFLDFGEFLGSGG